MATVMERSAHWWKQAFYSIPARFPERAGFAAVATLNRPAVLLGIAFGTGRRRRRADGRDRVQSDAAVPAYDVKLASGVITAGGTSAS